MNKIYLGQKTWRNAKAFITYNPDNNEIRVHGKFLDGRKYFPGPEVLISTAPKELEAELRNFSTGQKPSPKLETFIKIAWKKAKEINKWFNY